MNPAITAFGTQSSNATLPTSMIACEEIGVPEDIYGIVLPMGATMHMDGSVLSSIVKIAFLLVSSTFLLLGLMSISKPSSFPF